MSFRVSSMEVGHLPAVVALEAANQPRPWSEDMFREELGSDGRIYLVAEDPRVIGFGGVVVRADEAHVMNLFVEPGSRRRGVATALMEEMTKRAVETGARHLTLEVRVGNTAARALYAGLGMAPVGVRPGYYGNDDALIMWAHDIDQPARVAR